MLGFNTIGNKTRRYDTPVRTGLLPLQKDQISACPGRFDASSFDDRLESRFRFLLTYDIDLNPSYRLNGYVALRGGLLFHLMSPLDEGSGRFHIDLLGLDALMDGFRHRPGNDAKHGCPAWFRNEEDHC